MSKRRGFTMIEMMMVVAILGIMTAGVTLSIHKMNMSYNKYADVIIMHDLVTLQQGIDVYQRLYKTSPSNIKDLLDGYVMIGSPELSYGTYYIGRDNNDQPVAMFKNTNGEEYDITKFSQKF